ncbi:hypothetical protein LX36DRAFT_607370 [Colletotrichum falcatum]|nr:hypothetical protein LX36DRAFT_607370 [Colletotrichum falcatum]
MRTGPLPPPPKRKRESEKERHTRTLQSHSVCTLYAVLLLSSSHLKPDTLSNRPSPPIPLISFAQPCSPQSLPSVARLVRLARCGPVSAVPTVFSSPRAAIVKPRETESMPVALSKLRPTATKRKQSYAMSLRLMPVCAG